MRGSPPQTLDFTTTRFKSFLYALSVISESFYSIQVRKFIDHSLKNIMIALSSSTLLPSHLRHLYPAAPRRNAPHADDRRAARQRYGAARRCRGRELCALH